MSVSNDETMVMINNTHRGFDLYSVSQQSILHSFTENGLPSSAASVFVDSDRAVAYASGDGTIRLWDIRSKSIVLSVPNAGEVCPRAPMSCGLMQPPCVQEQSALRLTAMDVSWSSILSYDLNESRQSGTFL